MAIIWNPKQAVPLHAMADVEYVLLAWFLLILAFPFVHWATCFHG